MHYLRGNNLTVTYDDFNYTELNYTNYTDAIHFKDSEEIKNWIDWFASWWWW